MHNTLIREDDRTGRAGAFLSSGKMCDIDYYRAHSWSSVRQHGDHFPPASPDCHRLPPHHRGGGLLDVR